MAEEMKHDPGPWTASFSFHGMKPGIGDVWQIDCEDHAVCTTRFCYAPNTEANARLIAAAPELLHALMSAVAALEMADQTVDARGAQLIARAAIAKATGAPQ